MIGPSDGGHYYEVGNGAEGVLIDGSSNAVGGSGEATGNVISGNAGDGIQIVGPGATRHDRGLQLDRSGAWRRLRAGFGRPWKWRERRLHQ